MRLGRKDFGQHLEDALTYVPAEVSPATRVEILLSLARCVPQVTNEPEYPVPMVEYKFDNRVC